MPKLRVLVVDDDNIMRELLKAILREEGYRVAGEAKDGESALTACDDLSPEVVCLDVNMPGMSGIETLRILRGKHPQVRIIMITGDASLNTVREAVSLGAAGFIIKPFSQGRVADALRAALKPSAPYP
ncbi:MAG: response regulator [Hydrogenophilales bacterium]|nr:response regulator [Hydrogenophilales bacterium]